MIKHRLWFALAMIAWAPTLGAQTRGYEPTDYYNLVTASDVAVSPTGRHVAWVTTTVREAENARHREIWMQRVSAGRPEGSPFRFTSPTAAASDPTWSPDGSLLSFSSRRGDDENPIWFLRVEGAGGEAFHLDGVEGEPVWSPDGRWIAFVDTPSDPGPADGPESGAGWVAPDAVTKTLDPDRFDGRVITSMRYKRDGRLSLQPHYSVDGAAQIYVVPSEGGEARQITAVPFDAGAPVWSADSRLLFFTGNERQNDELNREPTGDVWVVSRQGGTVRRLTTDPGTETGPSVSPDGTRLAFRSTAERGGQAEILVVGLDSNGNFRGEPTNLTRDWDLSPGNPFWEADGTAVRFSAGVRGDSHLFRVGASGGPVAQVTSGARRLSGFSASDDGAVMAYVSTDPVRPPEVFMSAGNGQDERPISGFNDGWLADVELVEPEELLWTVDDGTRIQGWLVKPVGYRPGVRYPMVLKIHGGPHSAYGNTFFPTFHVLSAAGFFVLYSNPRGSSGYGHAFQYATRGQWGVVDKEDYLLGVEAALALYPDIDPERVGVSGGSYGGFMTNWLTATTDRFRAAVTSRSIVNWESWWGTSDAQGLTEFEFYGPPWEQRDLYRRLSPISYVENVTAPTLIIHSENDYRTPIGDGEQWFMSLMKRGVPTELVRYPRSSHGLSRTGEPWLLVDRLERIRSWFGHFLIGDPFEVAGRE